MIKLSLFMLDPVKSHEQYTKELQELKADIEHLQSVVKDMKKSYRAEREQTKEKIRQLKCEVSVWKTKSEKQ